MGVWLFHINVYMRVCMSILKYICISIYVESYFVGIYFKKVCGV